MAYVDDLPERRKIGNREKRQYRRLNEKRVAQLYSEGCNDFEIGRRLGQKTSTISMWRRRNGLPPIKPQRKDGSVAEIIRANIHKSNADIAKLADCRLAYVRAFRQREVRKTTERALAMDNFVDTEAAKAKLIEIGSKLAADAANLEKPTSETIAEALAELQAARDASGRVATTNEPEGQTR